MSRKWLWIPPALALAFLLGALALFAAEPDPRPSGDDAPAAESLPSASPRPSPPPPPAFRNSPTPVPRPSLQRPPDVSAAQVAPVPMEPEPPPDVPALRLSPISRPGAPPLAQDDEVPLGTEMLDPMDALGGPRAPGSHPVRRMRGGPHAAEVQ